MFRRLPHGRAARLVTRRRPPPTEGVQGRRRAQLASAAEAIGRGGASLPRQALHFGERRGQCRRRPRRAMSLAKKRPEILGDRWECCAEGCGINETSPEISLK